MIIMQAGKLSWDKLLFTQHFLYTKSFKLP